MYVAIIVCYQGRLYAVMNSMDNLIMPASSGLYNYLIYPNTVGVFPGAPYLVAACIAFPPIIQTM